MSDSDAKLIERYEICRATWIGRCRFLLRGRPPGVENLATLLCDEILDLIDKRLSEYEAQLPQWYPISGDLPGRASIRN
jgi:hypothetical protein